MKIMDADEISKSKYATQKQQVQTCSFYVSRKKRFCKMLVGKGKNFCGQHLVADETSVGQNRRIPCPLDPKHSCYEDKISMHLKICNARQKPAPEFCSRGINEGEESPDETSGVRQLQDLSDEELMHYIAKVQKIYEEYVDTIETKIRSHCALKVSLATPGIGHSAVRHIIQNASLLALLEERSLLSDEAGPKVFVEFGAGRGKLTGWIIEACQRKEEPLFVLIDKGSQRYKVDAKLKHKENLKIKRIRIDIQDLDLMKIDGIEPESTIVACGKHLCGAATDFSLRCLTNCQNGTVGGIVIALCCHHRCTWKAYPGKTFLKNIGFTASDFPVLLSLTSWAVSGSRSVVDEGENALSDDGQNLLSRDDQNQLSTDGQNPPPSDEQNQPSTEGQNSPSSDEQNLFSRDRENHLSSDGQNVLTEQPSSTQVIINENRYTRLGLSVGLREEIGRKMKQILDQGRVEYLKQCTDLKPALIQYVDQSSTLENIALVAFR